GIAHRARSRRGRPARTRAQRRHDRDRRRQPQDSSRRVGRRARQAQGGMEAAAGARRSRLGEALLRHRAAGGSRCRSRLPRWWFRGESRARESLNEDSTMRKLAQTIAVAMLATFTAGALAQSWPAKPVRFIVPYPPGGTSDILARTIGQKLGDALGQTIVVENKPGANGNVGAEFVAKAAPDGYTFLLADIGAIAISPSVYPTLPFDPVKDFSPVTMVAYSPHILAVHPSVPAQSVAELIALAK